MNIRGILGNMKTKTFHLRPLEKKDAQAMLQWMCDEDTVRFLPMGTKQYTLVDAEHFIENAKDETINLHRAVVDENDVYLGTISLKNIDTANGEAEFAIALSANARSTGAAAQAVKGIFSIAFRELGLRRVYLNVLAKNQRAVRFYEKLSAIGLRYEKQTLLPFDDGMEPLLWYQITK